MFLATDIHLPGACDWVMMQTCFGCNFLLVLEKQVLFGGKIWPMINLWFYLENLHFISPPTIPLSSLSASAPSHSHKLSTLHKSNPPRDINSPTQSYIAISQSSVNRYKTLKYTAILVNFCSNYRTWQLFPYFDVIITVHTESWYISNSIVWKLLRARDVDIDIHTFYFAIQKLPSCIKYA